MKKSNFSKLRNLNKDDKILLLTHTDMDGANVVVMNQMFDNVDVKNCSNNNMSYYIKKNVCEDNDYDAIVVVDISCSESDAEFINNNPNKKKLILLDHHPTALYLNQYDWAIVEPNLVRDSFRATYYERMTEGHSSGTSLLYDFLDYQGHTERVENKELLEEYVNNVAMYDTWDWHNLFDKAKEPKELEDVFEMYGIDMFQRLMSEKIKNGQELVAKEEIALLTSFKEKESVYVEKASESFKEGTFCINGREYTFLMSVSDDYLGPILEKMREDGDVYDLQIVNYGNGLSIRTTKDSINIGDIVSKFGGGGHQGAGGIRISKELQVSQIERNLFGTKFYIDRDDKGYIQTQKDVLKETVTNLEKYSNLPKEEALRMEAEDRKRINSVFLIKCGMITGTMLSEEDGYSSFAMAFTSSYKEEAKKEMKEMFPEADKYFICSETSFEYEDTKTGIIRVVEFSEDSILETMSEVFDGAEFFLTESHYER